MRFHGILLVRDEGDIIEEMLADTLRWADTIWALDTGSTDGTFERLKNVARSNAKLRVLGRHPLLFSQSIRSYIFNEARAHFADGDWIVKLDADEFYHVTPPEFVRNYASQADGAVFLKWYYFRLTDQEVRDYESGRVSIEADRGRPIAERRRFYKLTTHSEPRMFRYRSTMRFHHALGMPRFRGLLCRHFIPVRHYPHRDPKQLSVRFALRSCMIAMGCGSGRQWAVPDWRGDVMPHPHRAGGDTREHGGLASEPGHTDGPLHYWSEGDALPDITRPEPAETAFRPALRRGLHRAFYAGPVRLADRMIDGYAEPDMLAKRAIPDMAAVKHADIEV